jgi:isoleucyl-tRNA synthetase
MLFVMAPIVPHLAEEIYHATTYGGELNASVFMTKWEPLVRLIWLPSKTSEISFNKSTQSKEWEDPQAEQDMKDLLRVRATVLSALEKARGQKYALISFSPTEYWWSASDNLRAP